MFTVHQKESKMKTWTRPDSNQRPWAPAVLLNLEEKLQARKCGLTAVSYQLDHMPLNMCSEILGQYKGWVVPEADGRAAVKAGARKYISASQLLSGMCLYYGHDTSVRVSSRRTGGLSPSKVKISTSCIAMLASGMDRI